MVITASEARSQLFPLIAQVNNDSTPVVITSKKGNAVLVSESGVGKPEKLKYELSGLWSRRINHKDRLIYEIRDDTVFILELREH